MRDELIGLLALLVWFVVVGAAFFACVHALVAVLEFVAAMGT